MAAGLQTEAGDVAAADVWRQLRGAVRGSTDYARRDSIGALPQTPTRERRAGEPGEWSEAAAAAAVAAGEEPPPRPAEMPREYEPTAAAKLEAAVAVEPLLDALRTRMAEAAVVPDAAHFARRAQLALYCGDVLETLQSVRCLRASTWVCLACSSPLLLARAAIGTPPGVRARNDRSRATRGVTAGGAHAADGRARVAARL